MNFIDFISIVCAIKEKNCMVECPAVEPMSRRKEIWV
jgi:hypothetical protein